MHIAHYASDLGVHRRYALWVILGITKSKIEGVETPHAYKSLHSHLPTAKCWPWRNFCNIFTIFSTWQWLLGQQITTVVVWHLFLHMTGLVECFQHARRSPRHYHTVCRSCRGGGAVAVLAKCWTPFCRKYTVHWEKHIETLRNMSHTKCHSPYNSSMKYFSPNPQHTSSSYRSELTLLWEKPA